MERRLAKSEFTARQWQYSRAMHQDSVYAPQVWSTVARRVPVRKEARLTR
jgi:hypothetical protein